jgi:hypothetical protein
VCFSFFFLFSLFVFQAMTLRKAVRGDKDISKYFRFLTIAEMIPAEFRKTGLDTYLCDGTETKVCEGSCFLFILFSIALSCSPKADDSSTTTSAATVSPYSVCVCVCVCVCV